MNNKSAIEDLFSDSGPVNIEEIVRSIKPFLKIQREGAQIFLTDKGNKVGVNTRILLYALAKKLLKEEKFIDSEAISAKEIAEQLNIKKGSVDFGFSALRNKGDILGSGVNYTVPNDRINGIIKALDAIIKEKND